VLRTGFKGDRFATPEELRRADAPGDESAKAQLSWGSKRPHRVAARGRARKKKKPSYLLHKPGDI